MSLLTDLRLALRQLIASPAFTILAIATLGLGIGANAAMFSAFNGIVLKPLPYPDSAQLDRIYRTTPQNPEGSVSPADFLDLRRQMDGYGTIAAYEPGDASMSEAGHPAEMAVAARVSANLFSTLGVQPQLGRDFRPADDVHGHDRVLVISQRYWRNRFAGTPEIIGRVVRVDGEAHEIVGVLPATFNDSRHLGSIDLFRPLGLDNEQSADRRATILRLIGRRSGGGSHGEREEFIANFGARLAREFPDVHAGSTWRTVPLNDTLLRAAPLMISMMIGLSGFVVLIACSNLANLLLARTMTRAREFAVRSALGAAHRQLLRPLIAESLLVSVAGGLFAIIVARWVLDYLAVRSTFDNGDQVLLALDWVVLGWTLAVSLGTALALGLAPALFALRIDLNEMLKSGARGVMGGRGHQRFRQVLIVSQFALAMVLLAGAALFIRGLHDLNQRRAGWESDYLVTGTVLLPAADYPDADRITAFQRLAVERLESLPGVASASISSFTPFFNWADTRKYAIEGRTLPQPGHEPSAVVNNITPRYFETVGTRVVAGRAFNERDTLTSLKVFIINQAMARGLLGNENAIGRRLGQFGGDNIQWGEIVGIVADVKSVLPGPGPVTYQLYQPMAQEPRGRTEIAVHTAGVAPATLVAGIRDVMTDLDPDLPVRRLQPADATIHRANYTLDVLRDILVSFAVLGLGLAALGIYGVIARTMSQRMGEFAVRLALGARVRDITRMVLGSGLKLALTGSTVGLIGAAGVFRLLAATYPGMQFDNAPAIVGATAFLIAVALIACYLPARAASRISAADALR